MTINTSTAVLLNDLLRELSSELDLHYEDRDMHALARTISVMKAAATALQASDADLPDVYCHVIRRFEVATRS